jgi:hypothetical protein
LFKTNFFQVIGGIVNLINYENRRGFQGRGISVIHIPNKKRFDIAIAKVHLPFMYTPTVQRVTLSQAQFVPPGNKKHFQVLIIRKKSHKEIMSS